MCRRPGVQLKVLVNQFSQLPWWFWMTTGTTPHPVVANSPYEFNKEGLPFGMTISLRQDKDGRDLSRLGDV